MEMAQQLIGVTMQEQGVSRTSQSTWNRPLPMADAPDTPPTDFGTMSPVNQVVLAVIGALLALIVANRSA